MYAIVEISGKQYKIAKDDKLEVDKLAKDKGKVNFDKVLLYAKDDKNVEIGNPFITGASVDAEIIDTKRGEKIRVFKMKAKKRYSRTIGHRKEITVIQIKEINVGGAKKTPSAESATESLKMTAPKPVEKAEKATEKKKTTKSKSKKEA